MSVESTLAELVRIDSRSSVSNLALITHLLPRVEAAGLCARLFPYADERGVKKFNLVAVHPKTLEDGGEVELALVGHTDTMKMPQNPFIFGPFRPQRPLQRTCFAPHSHKIHTNFLSREANRT